MLFVILVSLTVLDLRSVNLCLRLTRDGLRYGLVSRSGLLLGLELHMLLVDEFAPLGPSKLQIVVDRVILSPHFQHLTGLPFSRLRPSLPLVCSSFCLADPLLHKTTPVLCLSLLSSTSTSNQEV